MEDILKTMNEQIFGVWFLAGAALVFWMQAGFAMVETGFTRAKNAGNIIMKNLMDFCIGTVVFILIGFGLFLGEDALCHHTYASDGKAHKHTDGGFVYHTL